jgi:hypothetical protein
MSDILETEVAAIPLDKLTKAYLKLRDQRAELKQQYQSQDSELEVQMQMLQDEMLNICKQTNATSIRTEYGTVIRQVKSRYWTNDWDSMYTFIREHEAFGLLEKRLHQTHMKEFLSENPDKLPMGLNVESEYTITVRRSS